MSSAVINTAIDNSRVSKQRTIMTIFIILMLPLSGMAIDIYTPSLVAISNSFHIASGLAQLTIALYLLGYGVFQLVTGLLSDAYGRRPLILSGLFGFAILSILIPSASNIYILLLLRFLQGISVAAFLAAGKAVLPDLYKGKSFNKVMTYMTSAWALGPVVAPIIGAHLAKAWSWHASFYFLSIYSATFFLIGFFILKETRLDKVSIESKVIFKNIKKLLSCFTFIRASFMVMSLYSFLIIFNTLAPFIIVKNMHYSPMFFGLAAFLIGGSYFLGMMASRFFVDIDSNKLSKIILRIIFLISILFLVTSLFVTNNIYVLLIPSMFIVFFSAFIFANQMGITLKLFPSIAGFAGAVSGCLFVASTGVLTSLITINHHSSVVYLASLYVGLSVFMLALNCFSKNKI